MSHAVVTVEIDQKQRIDLALPLDIPNQALAPALAQALELPAQEKETYLLSVKTEEGIVQLSPSATLGEAGILDGFILLLQRREGAPPLRDTGGRALLRAETGETFPLEADSILIGRKDLRRGWLVDIDLSPFDAGKITSRKHARITRQGGKYFIADLASVNGTRLNGQRLPTDEKHALQDGDVLEFGRGGVRLTFRAGGGN